MEHTTIAVDLAKSVFQVGVSHRPGRVDEERRLSRDRLLKFFAQQPPATVVLEACGSAHHWARQLQPLGHTVRLLPAHDVRPYVRRNKTDRTDAKGLLEANRNEELQPVPVKTIGYQAIASLHRLRSTWLATRTARLNTLRGLLREFGIFIPTGAQRVVPRVRALAGDTADVPIVLHTTLAAACWRRSGPRWARWRSCKPCRAWACSPPPRSWPSSPTSGTFLPGGISPAFSVRSRPPTRVIASSTVAHPEDCTERTASWRPGRTGAGARR